MSEIFVSSFLIMFLAVVKILMIALIAGLLVRKKVILPEHIKGLSEILVMVLLPSLMFSNTITTFKPQETLSWWILPLLGMGIPLLGILFSHLLFWKRPAHERNIIAVSSFPNAAYLVLPLGKVLFPEQFDEFSVYCFLFVLGFNIMLWSIGKYYVTSSGNGGRFKWRELVTPPLVANVSSVLLVLVGFHVYIPKIVLEPLVMIGSATVPMAIFVLGGTLGGISFKIWPKFFDMAKLVLVKYILVPATILLLLHFFPIRGNSVIFTTLLVLEASAAPSTNIIVIMRKYGGDIQQVGGLMIVSYFLAIILMPLWIALMDIIG
jgi:malate permease and related proteins